MVALLISIPLMMVAGHYFTGSVSWGVEHNMIVGRFVQVYHKVLPVYMTKEELAQYNGEDDSLPIYMGFKGKIYDVTAGRRYYGKGGRT
jgi:hypothetical protein